MTSIATADAILSVRGSDWATEDVGTKTAALAKAGDYIAATYALVADLTDSQQSVLDLATSLLADEFRKAQPALAAPTSVKESKEQLGTMLTDTIYFEAPSDPYPTITGLLRPLTLSAPSVVFGRMVR